MLPLTIIRKPGLICIRVHIQPRSVENKIIGLHGDAVKIRLTAPAVENRANRQLVEFLARTLRVSKQDIKLISGKTSRTKLVGFSRISEEKLLERVTPYLV